MPVTVVKVSLLINSSSNPHNSVRCMLLFSLFTFEGTEADRSANLLEPSHRARSGRVGLCDSSSRRNLSAASLAPESVLQAARHRQPGQEQSPKSLFATGPTGKPLLSFWTQTLQFALQTPLTLHPGQCLWNDRSCYF